MQKRGRIFAVCARMGDPLYQPARARLIWAAQTAQAVANVTDNSALLTGSGHQLPFKVENAEGARALKRVVSTMYNVAGDFDIMPLYPPPPDNANPLPYGRIEAEELFPRYVLPYVNMVHTRDPRIVRLCVKASTPVIYEDHNEDYHASVDPNIIGLNDPMVRAVVAITTAVADRLVLMGLNRSKIIVQDSGVNGRAFQRSPERSAAWRTSLLRAERHHKLAVYTGGMQQERGIQHILDAAAGMPDVMFAMAGGNRNDINQWIMKSRELSLRNVRFLGYLPQDQVIELQQAADVVLMTREPTHRGSITSPLKFFEYLASGTPIVGASMPAVSSKDLEGCTVNWYDPTDLSSLCQVIQYTFENSPRQEAGYRLNIDKAKPYTWEERQRNILSFANTSVSQPRNSL